MKFLVLQQAEDRQLQQVLSFRCIGAIYRGEYTPGEALGRLPMLAAPRAPRPRAPGGGSLVDDELPARNHAWRTERAPSGRPGRLPVGPQRRGQRIPQRAPVQLDVCDAQPELLRAANNCGQPTQEDCPICAESKVVLVSYVFGSRLPASGRSSPPRASWRNCPGPARTWPVMWSRCAPLCSWNHLARTFAVTGRRGERT